MTILLGSKFELFKSRLIEESMLLLPFTLYITRFSTFSGG